MIPVDFIDTAEKLLITDAPTEADIRSAISRSYYAVFHHTLLWWKSNAPFPNYKDRAHVKVQMALFNAGIPAAKDFSKDLRLLSNDRRKADYELTLKYDLANGQTTLDRARLAIAAFDALDKTALADGVEDYLRKTNQL
jgi:uncharacterized protein (UPF0332 family)